MNVDENELTAKVCTPCKGGSCVIPWETEIFNRI